MSLASLKAGNVYARIDSYKRAVADLNRALEISAGAGDVTVGLANCQSSSLSPLRSMDLIQAAETPKGIPFILISKKDLQSLSNITATLIGISLNYSVRPSALLQWQAS